MPEKTIIIDRLLLILRPAQQKTFIKDRPLFEKSEYLVPNKNDHINATHFFSEVLIRKEVLLN